MDHLRRAFHDISVGYTRGHVLGKPCYIKHLAYADQVGFDAKRDEFYAEARAAGTQSNEERLQSLRDQGLWNDVMEKEIADSKLMLDGLYEGKKANMKMPSMVKGYAVQIEREEKIYEEKLAKKRQLLGLTCESYAEQELNDFYIYSNLFEDEKLIQPASALADFDWFTGSELGNLIRDYNVLMDVCSGQNIKKLAMQLFFQEYFGLVGDNLTQFFGKPICQLTFFQVKLLNYGAHFRNIYQNNDVSKFPTNVLEDPDLLSDYASAAAKGKQEMQKQGAYDEGAIVVGMKKEDEKVLGIKGQTSLAAQIAKSGGNVVDFFASQKG